MENKVINIESIEQFADLLEQEDKPLIIDFYADWCQPCKMLSPVFDALVDEMNGDIHVVKVNIERQPEIAGRFMVRSVPTVVTVSKSEVVRGSVGMNKPSFYKDLAQEAIDYHSKG